MFLVDEYDTICPNLKIITGLRWWADQQTPAPTPDPQLVYASDHHNSGHNNQMISAEAEVAICD